jgi:hypothetical protein
MQSEIAVNHVMTEEEERELQRYVLTEELRRRLTCAPSVGYRWFMSENVIDLQKWRQRREHPKDHENQ